MKKLKILILILLLMPTIVIAEGGITIDPQSLTLEQGESKTIIITAYNTAADLSIESDEVEVASIDINEWEAGMVGDYETKIGEVTVTGVNEGTATITFTIIDGVNFDEEELTGQTYTVTVEVIKKETPNTIITPKENVDNPNTGIPNHRLLILVGIFITLIFIKYNEKNNIFKKLK